MTAKTEVWPYMSSVHASEDACPYALLRRVDPDARLVGSKGDSTCRGIDCHAWQVSPLDDGDTGRCVLLAAAAAAVAKVEGSAQ